MKALKSRKWNEEELQLSQKEYVISRFNTISLAERQRLVALCDKLYGKSLLPEEWVIVRAGI